MCVSQLVAQVLQACTQPLHSDMCHKFSDKTLACRRLCCASSTRRWQCSRCGCWLGGTLTVRLMVSGLSCGFGARLPSSLPFTAHLPVHSARSAGTFDTLGDPDADDDDSDDGGDADMAAQQLP